METSPGTCSKHRRRIVNPCGNFSPIAACRRLTGAKSSPSGSDSTNGSPRQDSQSPNRNHFEAFSQDDQGEEEDNVNTDVLAVPPGVLENAQSGPPAIFRTHSSKSAGDSPALDVGGAEDLPQPVHHDESREQEEQDFHEADLD